MARIGFHASHERFARSDLLRPVRVRRGVQELHVDQVGRNQHAIGETFGARVIPRLLA